VYFFLHFQYNGFFLFTIGAMLMQFVFKQMRVKDAITANRFFKFLLIALVPAWFLSLMWMRIPAWMYYAGVAGALIQLAALGYFVQLILSLKTFLRQQLHPIVKWFWLVAGSAFAIKILLQAFSAIPQLNTYAFGVRPIVIGFLHLVLLAFVSVFIVGYLFQQQFLQTAHSLVRKAACLFLIAVLLNEVLLMLQGVVAMKYETVPYLNYYLLGTAILLLTALISLLAKNAVSMKSSSAQ
jgi:hypothetical protein